jgi:hypothetical protein
MVVGFFLLSKAKNDAGARRGLALVMLAIALSGLPLLAYNRALTGSPFRFPQDVYFDSHVEPVFTSTRAFMPGCNRLGLGAGYGCGRVHDLADAISSTWDNLSRWLILAALGPLLFVAAVYAVVLAARHRPCLPFRREVFALGSCVVVVVVTYALYWNGGTCLGARFYHASFPALVVLAALGADAWFSRLGSRARGQTTSSRTALAALATGLALAIGVLTLSVREVRRTYWGVDARYRDVKRAWSHGKAIVLVAFREELPMAPTWWTTPLWRGGSWPLTLRAGGALALNEPTLSDEVIFGKFHPAWVSEVQRRFADRAIWVHFAGIDPEGDRLMPLEELHERESRSEIPNGDSPPPDNFDGYLRAQ